MTRTSLIALLLITSFAKAEVPDIARLFPPGTLAYAELHDPASLGPELAAIVKGSGLEDSLRLVHERRDKTKNMRDLLAPDDLAILSLFASPEIVGEFRKLRGAAVAVTGFNERQQPDIVAVLLTGESQGLGLAMRAYLTVDPAVRKIGVASGVPIFQIHEAEVQNGPNGQPLPANEKPVTEGFHQPTFAYTPGVIVVGSNRADVADVIARFQDSTKKSLADEPLFQASAAKNRKPGLFWFTLPGDYCEKIDAINKQTGDLIDDDRYAMLKLVANVKAIRTASGGLRFRDKGLSLTADMAFEAGATSPLLAMLEGEGNDATALKHLPADAASAILLTLPAEKRAEAVLGFLDAIARANGALGRRPSQAAAEIAAKFKIDLAKDLLAKTRSITLVLPSRQELPKGAQPWPTFVIHGEASAAWADGVRAVVADLAGLAELPQSSTEIVDGVKVFSLPAVNLPWKAPVHFAWTESLFAVGLDRKVIAACIKGQSAAPNLPPGLETKAAAMGCFFPGRLLQLALQTSKIDSAQEGPRIVGEELPVRGGIRNFRHQVPSNQPLQPELLKQEAKAFEEMLHAIVAMPPAFGTVRRSPKSLHLEWFAPEIQAPVMARSLDCLITWLDRMLAASGRDVNDRQSLILPQ